MFDSSVLLAGPAQAGSTPAVVFECAAVAKGADGVTVRLCGSDKDAISREAITCTNWFRARPGAPANPADYRYELIRKVLLAKTGRNEKVDFAVARKAIGAARVPITVHSVVADLDTLDFWYAPGKFLAAPGEGDFVKLPMKEWLTEGPKR